VSGPNSTIVWPGHPPKPAVTVTFATKGFWVFATAVALMPGGSLNFALPQAIVKPHKVKIENKRYGCSGAKFFIAYLFLRDDSCGRPRHSVTMTAAVSFARHHISRNQIGK
jgi:hypothetical protein